MRKLLSVLICMLILLLSASAYADITVTGIGETLVEADTAVISLGVSARDRDVLQAQAKVNETIAAIRSALIEGGVEAKDISTDYINIYAMVDYREGTEELAAYNANSTLAIRITNMDIVGQVIDTAFTAGANTLNGISFSASDISEAKAEALKAAVADATAKAEILAAAANLTILGIDDIQEVSTYSFDRGTGNNFPRVAETKQDSAGTVIQAAKLTVSANISVSFDAK